jgi:SecD/SecF fusion protein
MLVKSKAFDKKQIMLFGKTKKKKTRDFIKFSKWPTLISVIVIVVGILAAVGFGFNFGVDFTGGTNINISATNKIDFEQVKEIVKEYDVRDYDYYLNSNTEGFIKLNDILTDEQELEITNKLSALGMEISLNEISNLVTNTLTKNAIKALLYSMVAIVIYVSIRFNFNYALSGLLMLLHDVLIILAIFAIFRINVDFIIVAALLTIVGYSINDTIVVFDRIRDTRNKLFKNKKKLTKEELTKVVNMSSSETISRNVYTSITTIIAVITLIAVGLNDILTFNIAILIGLIAGSMSSLLIGPTLLMYLEKRSMDKPEEDDFDDGPEELKIKGINS